MTNDPLVSVRGMRKSFGDQLVLDGIDLDVRAGSVVALLGQNGAGKTTTVQILSTLLRADGGTATVGGHDVEREPAEVRSAIGVTGQFSAVDGLLTGRENMDLMRRLLHLERPRGQQRIEDLLGRLDLTDAADRPASEYSGGMRRRLDLAMTLLGDPKVIFLDEPTTGLDPGARREVWRIIGEAVAGGVAVLLTTQYLEEADHLADHVAVLHGGRLAAEGTSAQLKRSVPGGHVRLEFADADRVAAAEATLAEAEADLAALAVDVPYDGTTSALRDILTRLDAASIEVDHVATRMPDLDDVFLALTATDTAPAGAR